MFLKQNWSLLFGLFLVVITNAYEKYDYCDPNLKLCDNPDDHVMCEFKSSALAEPCDVVKDTLSQGEKDIILKIHNDLRSAIAMGTFGSGGVKLPTAADMMELHWDEELELLAKRLTLQCRKKSDSDKCRNVKRFPVGQNIGMVGFPEIVPLLVENLIELWFPNQKDFNPDYVEKFTSDVSNDTVLVRFTEMIWAKTNLIGCALLNSKENASHRRGSWINYRLICNYGPTGNVVGEPVYTIGPPGSRCKRNSNRYKGLCEDTVSRQSSTTLLPSWVFGQEGSAELSTAQDFQEETLKFETSDSGVDHMMETTLFVTETSGSSTTRTSSSSISRTPSVTNAILSKAPHPLTTSAYQKDFPVTNVKTIKGKDMSTRTTPVWTSYKSKTIDNSKIQSHPPKKDSNPGWTQGGDQTTFYFIDPSLQAITGSQTKPGSGMKQTKTSRTGADTTEHAEVWVITSAPNKDKTVVTTKHRPDWTFPDDYLDQTTIDTLEDDSPWLSFDNKFQNVEKYRYRVSRGIYFNNKCHCSDIMRSSAESRPPKFIFYLFVWMYFYRN